MDGLRGPLRGHRPVPEARDHGARAGRQEHRADARADADRESAGAAAGEGAGAPARHDGAPPHDQGGGHQEPGAAAAPAQEQRRIGPESRAADGQ